MDKQLLFRKLLEAHQWGIQHDPLTDEDIKFFDNKLMPAVDRIIQQLKDLGVDPSESAAVFVFGQLMNDV